MMPAQAPHPTHVLNDGNELPLLGLGTAPMSGSETSSAVRTAVQLGYRLIDTGAAYGNEAGVGTGLRNASVAREEVTVVTKVRGRDHGFAATLDAFEASRRRLDVGAVDLYLIHWPLPQQDLFVETWKALIELRERGLVRSIGVSNFLTAHLLRLVDETGVAPAVNQIELHPGFDQADLRRTHEDLQIRTMSYSPLGRGTGLLADPTVVQIAGQHDATPAQVVLAWHLSMGAVPVAKAASAERQAENLKALDVRLSTDEIESLTHDVHSGRIGFDPNDHEEY